MNAVMFREAQQKIWDLICVPLSVSEKETLLRLQRELTRIEYQYAGNPPPSVLNSEPNEKEKAWAALLWDISVLQCSVER